MESASLATRENILHHALTLNADDRAFLAEELERSLPAERNVDDELAAAWSREIDRRIAAYDRGETTAISFEASLAHVRQALVEHRSQRALP